MSKKLKDLETGQCDLMYQTNEKSAKMRLWREQGSDWQGSTILLRHLVFFPRAAQVSINEVPSPVGWEDTSIGLSGQGDGCGGD